MTFSSGDRVHVAGLGTGVVRERRNARLYLVELKGRALVVPAVQLARADGKPGRPRPRLDATACTTGRDDEPAATSLSLDLHGRTVAEATEALDTFLNDALLAGHAAVQVIHGRSGGRVKAAVHHRLASLPSVRGFQLDPRNPGATIVRL